MNLAELEAAQAANVAPVIRSVTTTFAGYASRQVTLPIWRLLLQTIFPQVASRYTYGANLARRLYEKERAKVTDAPMPNRPLPRLSFERFVKDMEEVRPLMMKPNTTANEVARAALRVARTVENGGRREILRAVSDVDEALDDQIVWEEDDEFTSSEISLDDLHDEVNDKREAKGKSRLVRGWARVPTGAETCGWCWMLASRGPVYKTAKTAGARFEFDAGGGELVGEQMNAWHDGCDCKIVPVFTTRSWEGRDRWQAAEALWNDVTRRQGYRGHEARKAFRREVEAGRIQELLQDAQVAA